MNRVIIRQENENDLEDIYKINQLAFGQENESKLINLLRKSENWINGLSLVALIDNEIKGHILFTKLNIKDNQGKSHLSLALAPMSVHPDFQKKGIGSMMIQKGIEVAKEKGFKSVIVLGHKDYYPKFGFSTASNWNITTTYDVPKEYYMAMELVPGGLKGVAGVTEYAKEFAEV